MKTFGLATVLALLLAAPAVAATDENISIETLLKDGWQIAGYAAANQSAVEFSDDSIAACGPVVPRAVPRKLRRNPQSKRHLALLQAALSATRRNGATNVQLGIRATSPTTVFKITTGASVSVIAIGRF